MRIALLFLCFAAVCAPAFGQGLRSEDLWLRLERGLTSGCVNKELQTSMSRAVDRGVLEDSCRCLSRRVVDDVRRSPGMERAIADGNSSVIEQAIKSAVQKATADRQSVAACFEAALGDGDRSGKLDPSKASKETVLRSADFQRFRDDLFKDCYGDGSRRDQKSHERQHRLCTCFVDQLASGVTESDMVSFHLDPDAGRKRLLAASEAALAKCSAVSGR